MKKLVPHKRQKLTPKERKELMDKEWENMPSMSKIKKVWEKLDGKI